MITFEGVKKVKTITQPIHNRSLKELLEAQNNEYKAHDGQKNVNVFTRTRLNKRTAKTDVFVATEDEGRILNNLDGAKTLLMIFKIQNNIHPDKAEALENKLFSAIKKAQNFMLKHGKKD
ncbi:MAG: hypothetical protein WCF95_04185 [bacterium]